MTERSNDSLSTSASRSPQNTIEAASSGQRDSVVNPSSNDDSHAEDPHQGLDDLKDPISVPSQRGPPELRDGSDGGEDEDALSFPPLPPSQLVETLCKPTDGMNLVAEDIVKALFISVQNSECERKKRGQPPEDQKTLSNNGEIPNGGKIEEDGSLSFIDLPHPHWKDALIRLEDSCSQIPGVSLWFYALRSKDDDLVMGRLAGSINGGLLGDQPPTIEALERLRTQPQSEYKTMLSTVFSPADRPEFWKGRSSGSLTDDPIQGTPSVLLIMSNAKREFVKGDFRPFCQSLGCWTKDQFLALKESALSNLVASTGPRDNYSGEPEIVPSQFKAWPLLQEGSGVPTAALEDDGTVRMCYRGVYDGEDYSGVHPSSKGLVSNAENVSQGGNDRVR